MEVVYRCCCGIDVHKKLIVACLNKGGRQELLEFGTVPSEIKAMANWLTEADCEPIRHGEYEGVLEAAIQSF